MAYGLRLYTFTDGSVIIKDSNGYTRYPKESRIGFEERTIFTVTVVFDSYEKWCMDNDIDESKVKDYYPRAPPLPNCRSLYLPMTLPVKDQNPMAISLSSMMMGPKEPQRCPCCKDKGIVILGGALEPCPICHGECIKDVVVKDGGK